MTGFLKAAAVSLKISMDSFSRASRTEGVIVYILACDVIPPLKRGGRHFKPNWQYNKRTFQDGQNSGVLLEEGLLFSQGKLALSRYFDGFGFKNFQTCDQHYSLVA